MSDFQVQIDNQPAKRYHCAGRVQCPFNYPSSCQEDIASFTHRLHSYMSESFAELFEESISNAQMKTGSILTGTVVDITGDYVIVNAGLKSEGAVPIEEFENESGEADVKIGDTVEVALDSVEDGFGETKLSHEKARRARSWTVLEKAQENDEIIKGNITGKVKGGFTCL